MWNKKFDSAIVVAAASNNVHAINMLAPLCSDSSKSEALHVATESRFRLHALKSLVAHGAPIDAKLPRTPGVGVFTATVLSSDYQDFYQLYHPRGYFFGKIFHQDETKHVTCRLMDDRYPRKYCICVPIASSGFCRPQNDFINSSHYNMCPDQQDIENAVPIEFTSSDVTPIERCYDNPNTFELKKKLKNISGT